MVQSAPTGDSRTYFLGSVTGPDDRASTQTLYDIQGCSVNSGVNAAVLSLGLALRVAGTVSVFLARCSLLVCPLFFAPEDSSVISWPTNLLFG